MEISFLSAVYPAVWGMTQLGTGVLSDRVGRKKLIAGGMLLQGTSIIALVLTAGFFSWALCGSLLGIGTAMVYPHSSPLSETPRIPVGAHHRWASIDSGGMLATRWEQSSQGPLRTASGWRGPSRA